MLELKFDPSFHVCSVPKRSMISGVGPQPTIID